MLKNNSVYGRQFNKMKREIFAGLAQRINKFCEPATDHNSEIENFLSDLYDLDTLTFGDEEVFDSIPFSKEFIDPIVSGRLNFAPSSFQYGEDFVRATHWIYEIDFGYDKGAKIDHEKIFVNFLDMVGSYPESFFKNDDEYDENEWCRDLIFKRIAIYKRYAIR